MNGLRIVKMSAPAGARKVLYGEAEMRVAEDGTLDVPAYVGAALLSLGFSCGEDLSNIDIAADLARLPDAHAQLERMRSTIGDVHADTSIDRLTKTAKVASLTNVANALSGVIAAASYMVIAHGERHYRSPRKGPPIDVIALARELCAKRGAPKCAVKD